MMAAQQVAVMVIDRESVRGRHAEVDYQSQAGFARRAGLDRATVRGWLGQRLGLTGDWLAGHLRVSARWLRSWPDSAGKTKTWSW